MEESAMLNQIINFSIGVLIALFIANPLHFRDVVRKLEFKILREATRTDNWGTEYLYLGEPRKSSEKRYRKPSQ